MKIQREIQSMEIFRVVSPQRYKLLHTINNYNHDRIHLMVNQGSTNFLKDFFMRFFNFLCRLCLCKFFNNGNDMRENANAIGSSTAAILVNVTPEIQASQERLGSTEGVSAATTTENILQGQQQEIASPQQEEETQQQQEQAQRRQETQRQQEEVQGQQLEQVQMQQEAQRQQEKAQRQQQEQVQRQQEAQRLFAQRQQAIEDAQIANLKQKHQQEREDLQQKQQREIEMHSRPSSDALLSRTSEERRREILEKHQNGLPKQLETARARHQRELENLGKKQQKELEELRETQQQERCSQRLHWEFDFTCNR